MTYLTSPDGLPAPDNYAEPADAPLALRQLADATQVALNSTVRLASMRTGVKNVTVRANSSGGSGTVVFGVTLPSGVRVQATAIGSGVWNVNVQDVTTTGCVVNVRNVTDTTFGDDVVIPVHWLAIGGLG